MRYAGWMYHLPENITHIDHNTFVHTVDRCKKLWRNLRSTYHIKLKHNRAKYEIVTGLHAGHYLGTSTWSFYEYMHFVANTYPYRKLKESYGLLTYYL